MSMRGKVAVITGGSRGIGRAIALEFARRGADVAFTFASNQAAAGEVVAQIEGLERRVLALRADVTQAAEMKEAIATVTARFGRIDILVNNAGIVRDRVLAMMSEEEWTQVITTSLTGVFHGTRAAIMGMIKRREGRIVNLTSTSGIRGVSGQTNYSAAKAGIIGFTKALAREVAPFNILVNAIAPGAIETDMLSGLKQQYVEAMRELIPLKRLGKPEEVAALAAFLAGEENTYVTGHVFPIDGGLAA